MQVKSLEATISTLLVHFAKSCWTVEDMKALPFYLSVPLQEALNLDLCLQHTEDKPKEDEYLQYLLLSGKKIP